MRVLLLASTILALAGVAPAPVAFAQQAAPDAAVAAALVPQGKLPDAVIPSAYRLDLTIDPAQPRFLGHVEIDGQIRTPSQFIYLHGRDLAMHKATATIAGKTYAATWSQVDPTGVAMLRFAEPLPAGPATFAFDYDAAFQDGPAGLFHVKVGDDWYSWSQFESIDARSAYPGFDQPGYKQPFTLTLRTPRGLKAISNAPETGVRDEGGLDVHRFAPTAPLPTYLLAMMVGPFAEVASAAPPSALRAAPLPMRIISTRQNATKLSFALENSKSIVTHLEEYFGQAFPFPKLDQITSPIMPGAMENAGADLYQDNLLVLDEAASTPQKRNFGMVVAHELAHQWFGDMVTPAWWDDIWLNESFANWMGYRIGSQWRPDLNIGNGALAEGFAAMNTDGLVAGRAIHQPITQNAQIDAAFDSITYGKGGHVVAMIAAFMGDAKFRDGVRRYMAAHRYGNASSAEFFGAMADVAGDPRILPAMQSFTDQQGVPLLTFAGADGHFTVTQSRYARLGTTPPGTSWGVPMCLRRGDVRQCALIDQPHAEVTIAGSGPLVPNAGGTGYYRFELPAAEWDRLIAASAQLPSGEALALADSLRASFMAGRASAAQLVELARVMAANPDSYASGAALSGLGSLGDWGLLDAKATKASSHFVAGLYRPQLEKFGFDPRRGAYTGEDPERSQRRAQIVEQLSGMREEKLLRGQLAQAVKARLAGDAAALDPAWYGAGFAVFLAENRGKGTAESLTETALTSSDPLLRPALLQALATTGRPKIVRWLLDTPKDSRLRQSEWFQMVAGITMTPATREMGYGWLNAHLDELLTGGSGVFFAARLPQLVAGFCSAEKAQQIARDFGPRLAGKTAQLELDRTVERVRSCGFLKAARSVEASEAVGKLQGK